jgi:hypothetical protein
MGTGNSGIVSHLGSFVLMNNIDASVNYVSDPLNINSFVLYAIQFSWDSFATLTSAVVSTEGSNDGSIWTSIDTFIPSTGTASRILNVEKAGYAFVRISYNQVGASGTLKAILNGKVT